jgi:cilia- and flagella-associated protein 57
MSELQRSVEELKLEHEYQLRLKDMNFNEKLKDLTEKFSQEIEALKISTSVLRTEKDKEEVKHEEELQNVKAKHLNELHVILNNTSDSKNKSKKYVYRKLKPNTIKSSWRSMKNSKIFKIIQIRCRTIGKRK